MKTRFRIQFMMTCHADFRLSPNFLYNCSRSPSINRISVIGPDSVRHCECYRAVEVSFFLKDVLRQKHRNWTRCSEVLVINIIIIIATQHLWGTWYIPDIKMLRIEHPI